MIEFDLYAFLLEKRKSISNLSKLLRMPLRSISIMVTRGTVKPSFIELLETHFGDCSKFIKHSENEAA